MGAYGWLALAMFIGAIAFFVYAMRRWKGKGRKWLAALVTLALMVGAAYLFVFPPGKALATTGQFGVVTVDRWFERPEPDPALATGPGTREIPATVYHPAGQSSAGRRLVVFSHGSFGTRDSNESLYRELASHGDVVVSLDHPRHSFSTTLKDGKSVYVDGAFFKAVNQMQGSSDVVSRWKASSGWMKVRTDDMGAVLDHIAAGDPAMPELGGVDSHQVILSGHSLGGCAALALGRTRPDVKAVVALESPYFGDITGADGQKLTWLDQPYPKPVLMFYSDATWAALNQAKAQGTDAEEYQQNVRLLEPSEKFSNVYVERVGHIGLTDLSIHSPVLTNVLDQGKTKADPKVSLRRINDETLSFLARQAG